MGGSGQRFGRALPKQFTEIKGKPYFSYIFEDYDKVDSIDKFIVVTNSNYLQLTQKYAEEIFGKKLLGVIPGGETSLKSTYNGVRFAAQLLADDDILLTHDITNSSVDSEVVKQVIEAAMINDVATNGTEQVQAIFTKDAEDGITGTIAKNSVISGYSPDAYRMALIKSCFDDASEDNLQNMVAPLDVILAKGYKPKVIKSHTLPLKLTYDKDLETFMKIHGLWDWK